MAAPAQEFRASRRDLDLARHEPSPRATLYNAGHPPALLHRAAGTVEPLNSTAMLLGAMSASDYEVTTHTLSLAPNDLLLLYTDGAQECLNSAGAQFSISGIQTALQSSNPTVESALDTLTTALNHRATPRHRCP